MRILVALAILALLSVSLAGCSTADKERYPNGVPTSSSHSTSRSGSTTSAGLSSRSSTSSGTGSASSHAPTANLTAAPANGTAPLNVTFAVAGGDADANAILDWSLTFGDGNQTNGTILPQNVTHQYMAGGNFTVRLVVSDGNLSANATLLVRVLPGLAGFAPGMDPNCQRPDAIEIPGTGLYSDDRGSPAGGFVTGGGNWIYQESNDLPGLQLSQNEGQPLPGQPPDIDPVAVQFNCVGGDTLVF